MKFNVNQFTQLIHHLMNRADIDDIREELVSRESLDPKRIDELVRIVFLALTSNDENNENVVNLWMDAEATSDADKKEILACLAQIIQPQFFELVSAILDHPAEIIGDKDRKEGEEVRKQKRKTSLENIRRLIKEIDLKKTVLENFPNLLETIVDLNQTDILLILLKDLKERNEIFLNTIFHRSISREIYQRGPIAEKNIYSILGRAITSNGSEAQKRQMVQILLTFGADPNHGQKEATPLCSALELGYYDIAVLLLTHGAWLNSCDSNRIPPLLYALKGYRNTHNQQLLDLMFNELRPRVEIKWQLANPLEAKAKSEFKNTSGSDGGNAVVGVAAGAVAGAAAGAAGAVAVDAKVLGDTARESPLQRLTMIAEELAGISRLERHIASDGGDFSYRIRLQEARELLIIAKANIQTEVVLPLHNKFSGHDPNLRVIDSLLSVFPMIPELMEEISHYLQDPSHNPRVNEHLLQLNHRRVNLLWAQTLARKGNVTDPAANDRLVRWQQQNVHTQQKIENLKQKVFTLHGKTAGFNDIDPVFQIYESIPKVDRNEEIILNVFLISLKWLEDIIPQCDAKSQHEQGTSRLEKQHKILDELVNFYDHHKRLIGVLYLQEALFYLKRQDFKNAHSKVISSVRFLHEGDLMFHDVDGQEPDIPAEDNARLNNFNWEDISRTEYSKLSDSQNRLLRSSEIQEQLALFARVIKLIIPTSALLWKEPPRAEPVKKAG